jgi:hypothetical protein
MEMLGMPLEERKKAYAGKTMSGFGPGVPKSRAQRDLPQ